MFVKFLIYYLLSWPEDNQWHNANSLRTKAKNIRLSNKKYRFVKWKIGKKSKTKHLLLLLYCIDLKQNKCSNVRIAHFENMHKQ